MKNRLEDIRKARGLRQEELARVDASGVQLSAEALAAERASLGLDKPFLVQYLIWLEGFLRGDLGVSYVSGEDVFATFLSKLPATLLLAAMSMLLTLVISIPLGILAPERGAFLFARRW